MFIYFKQYIQTQNKNKYKSITDSIVFIPQEPEVYGNLRYTGTGSWQIVAHLSGTFEKMRLCLCIFGGIYFNMCRPVSRNFLVRGSKTLNMVIGDSLDINELAANA